MAAGPPTKDRKEVRVGENLFPIFLDFFVLTFQQTYSVLEKERYYGKKS
jgi:hypothetical protein